MKTLAELKKDVASGRLYGKMILRSGMPEIPEKMSGWRKMEIGGTKKILFVNPDGNKSFLEVDRASLIEYDGESLTTYFPGYRELTEIEKKAMNEWREIEKELNSSSSIYWKEKYFYQKKGMLYLMGCEKQRGLKYDFNTQQIQDDSIKGEVCLKYEIKSI